MTVKQYLDLYIPARVEAGFNWYLENHPDKLLKIDRETLEMRSACGCMIGQGFGDYDTGIKQILGIGEEDLDQGDSWAVKHGFLSPARFPEFEDYQHTNNYNRNYAIHNLHYYPALTQEWKRRLALIVRPKETVT